MNFRNQLSQFTIRELIRNGNYKLKKRKDVNDYLEFNNKRKYYCKDKEKYLKNGFSEKQLELVTITPNQHQPGENLRAFSEFKNAVTFFKLEDGIFVKDIIDVGPGLRLNINNIARVGVAPNMELTDYKRHIKFNESDSLILNIDYKKFINDYRDLLSTWDYIFNFTDCLYYVDIHCSDFNKEGIVGCGTMHIYKYDGSLQFDTKFGNIIKDKEKGLITMTAFGNMYSYHHDSKYESLITNDAVLIDTHGEYKLYINKELHFDCGATAYIAFSIIRTKIDHIPRTVEFETDDNLPVITIGVGKYDVEILKFDVNYKVRVATDILDKVRVTYNHMKKEGLSEKQIFEQLVLRIQVEQLELTIKEMQIIARFIMQQHKNIFTIKINGKDVPITFE
jgi:hypothetical protein